MTDFAPTSIKGLLTLWDFEKDSKSTVEDQSPTGGLENGHLLHGAEADHGRLELDGHDDYMVAGPDHDWQDLDEGRIELVFTQDEHVGHSPDTLLSRDSQGFDDGGHLNMAVTEDGRVEVRHQDEHKSYFYKTPEHFFSEGDDVRVTYAWDSDGDDGFFKVENLTTGHTFEHDIHDKLTLDNGHTSEPITIGASQRVSDDNQANHLTQYFNGEISYVAIYDAASPAADPDGVVDGEETGEVMVVGYDDSNAPNDGGGDRITESADVIEGNGGDDTIDAGGGNDLVFGGDGDDDIRGADGNDVIMGDAGDDHIDGGRGNDTIFGDGFTPGTPSGPNLIVNGSFEDTSGAHATGYGYAASGGIPGWTEDTHQEFDIHDDGRGGVDPTDGHNWLDLDASPGNVRVGQSVSGVEHGEVYRLTFDAGDKNNEPQDGSGENLVNVYWGGQLVGTIDPNPGTMDTYTFDLIGGAGNGHNRLEFEGTGDEDNFGASIDNVELYSIDMTPAGSGNDTLEGGDGADLIDGGAGDDRLFGQAGSDRLIGGDGNDSLFGGTMDDTLDGGDGDDTLRGGTGDDEINGGAGNDSIVDTDGDNLVVSGNIDTAAGLSDGAPDVGFPFLPGTADPDPFDDRDTVTTGDGDDTIITGDDDDVIDAGNGDNVIDAGYDDDLITTGSGSDSIIGGEGDDTIFAGDGDDTIIGGTGIDALNITDDGSGGFPGPDPLPAANPLLSNGNDLIHAGAGNDSVLGEDDDDTIFGGSGNDTLDGGIDEDSIFGDGGDDSIIGGQGDDSLYGGSGNDTIEGGEGDDLIVTGNFNGTQPVGDPTSGDNTGNSNLADGGEGNDTILASVGDDTLLGGAGDDSILGNRGDDDLQGGDGSDTLDGQAGADLIDGGAGDDDITVNGGDTALGGAGDDEFVVTAVGSDDATVTVIGGETDEEDVIDPTNNPEGRIGDVLDLSRVNLQTLVYDPTDPTFDPVSGVGESGTATYLNNSGDTVTLNFSEIENVIPCFTPGALIATPTGEKPVESLREGDRVITRDNGIQEIRWIGQRTLNRDELARAPQMRPIFIKAGSLGDNLPERDMIVSPQHRLLVSGERTQLYFDESEVLVAAKHLVNGGGIRKLDTLRTTYVHFMFDQHEVVLSDGAWTESFQPGDHSLGSMGREARDEILALFPELASTEGRGAYAAARRSLKAHEARLLEIGGAAMHRGSGGLM